MDTTNARQQTLDTFTLSPSRITHAAKRKRSPGAVDVDQYRDEEGRVSARGKKEINRNLLKTLKKEDNPITNSDLYDRTAHVVTCATDVRQTIARSGAKFYISEKEYFASRHRKLGEQFGAKAGETEEHDAQDPARRSRTGGDVTQVFTGATFWINGYTGPRITSMELQRRIITHGGRISLIDSKDVTHVVVYKDLSARKTEKMKSTPKKQVVAVDWVLDSIANRAHQRTTAPQAAQAQPPGATSSGVRDRAAGSAGTRQVADSPVQHVGRRDKRVAEVICIDEDDDD